MSLSNIPDGGYDPADIPDDDEVEDCDDFDESVEYEESDWEARTERYWYPGPK
jgi:hypothetical protein